MIPFTCITFTDSWRRTDKWPVFVQVHCSIDVANMHKWQIVIKYTRLCSDMMSLQNNWASELNCGTLLCFLLARFPVGQNIAITWTTRTNAGAAPDFRRQVTGWFSEVRHFGFYSLPFKKGTGHYSQVGIKMSPCYHVQSSTHENTLTLAVMAQVEVGALDAYEQSPFSSYNRLDWSAVVSCGVRINAYS